MLGCIFAVFVSHLANSLPLLNTVEPTAKRAKLELIKMENDILDKWSAPLDTIPSVEKLKELFASIEFPAPIPVPLELEESVIGLMNTSRLKNVVRISSQPLSLDFLYIFLGLMTFRHSGKSEDSWHKVYDTLMTDVFGILDHHSGINIRCDRNTIEATSYSTIKGNKRPDFLLWLQNGLLVFKGEEKRGLEGFNNAKTELSDKAWFCHPFYIDRNFPYQLCYAAAGGVIQFFCLDLNNGNAEPITNKYDLSSSPIARAEFLLAVITVFRVVRTLHNKITLKPKLELGLIVKSNEDKTSVFFRENHIKKVTSLFTGKCIFDLYKKITDAKTTNVVRCLPGHSPKSHNINCTEFIILHLAPLGDPTYPSNSEEIKKAARDTLIGMFFIHSFGYVIRDIRPQNVLRDLDGSYFLIDFEWAAPIGSPLNDVKFKLEPPEIKINDSWEITSDLWQFGK